MIIKINNKKFRILDCRGLKSMKGLMFNDMKDIDGALIYGNSIWMPFVKEKLDLFFLDKNLAIIEKQKAVPMRINPKTWKVYENKKAKYCLELKKGILKDWVDKKIIL